jgi:hypothetical protein
MLLTFEELAGGLRRAGDAGMIREVGSGRYVDSSQSTLGGPVGDLTADAYDAAVVLYREDSAREVGQVMSSRAMRASTKVFEWLFRLSGGRLGLEPGVVDLDGISLSFSLDLVLDPIGWACEVAHRNEGVRMIDVRPVDGKVVADRQAVVTTIQQVVSGSDRYAGRHRVVFPDGVQVDLA